MNSKCVLHNLDLNEIDEIFDDEPYWKLEETQDVCLLKSTTTSTAIPRANPTANLATNATTNSTTFVIKPFIRSDLLRF